MTDRLDEKPKTPWWSRLLCRLGSHDWRGGPGFPALCCGIHDWLFCDCTVCSLRRAKERIGDVG